MNTFVSHLECSYTGEKYNKNEIYNLSNAGKPLLVKYYLDQIKEKITVNRDAITGNKLNHNCEVGIFESIGRKLDLFLILICNQKIDNG